MSKRPPDAADRGRKPFPDDVGALLAGIVRERIVPALHAGRMARSPDAGARHNPDIELLRCCISVADPEPVEAFLKGLIRRGLSRHDIVLGLFVPMARDLGEAWLRDDCSFADVMLGVARLTRLMRSNLLPPIQPRLRLDAPSACFVTLGSEDHSFGLVVLEDVFRADGWSTALLNHVALEKLLMTCREVPVDVLGFSLADEKQLPLVMSIVRMIRQSLGDGAPHIMVGGSLFYHKPELAMAIPSMEIAYEASDALEMANMALVERRRAV